jgi:hypothetical protein
MGIHSYASAKEGLYQGVSRAKLSLQVLKKNPSFPCPASGGC